MSNVSRLQHGLAARKTDDLAHGIVRLLLITARDIQRGEFDLWPEGQELMDKVVGSNFV